MSKEAITQYIAELNRIYKAGNATEHTYRPALKSLLENITNGLTITNEPKRIACGAPDYIVTRNEIPVGYIEAKDIDTDLDHKSHKEQFDRYKQSLNNLIITDYLTFQLFENDGRDVINHVSTVTIAKTTKNGIIAVESEFETFIALINLFVGYQGQGIQNSVQLSKIMAAKTRLMANSIENALDSNENTDDNSLIGQLNGFREVLIGEISHKEFADMYAQTIAYGMFAAKLNDTSPNPSPLNPPKGEKGGEFTPTPLGRAGEGLFTRKKAAELIPHSNPFLRKFFQYIAGYDLDERIRWVVDDLADLFNYVDINVIIKEFSKTDHDPIIHFYETFLSEYDPALRKSRGVWYTPKPVVQFIVQAVDDILKQDFNIPDGLADASYTTPPLSEGAGGKLHRVQILDPATGTGTFLAEVVQNIYQRFKNQQGMWQNYASEHLIPRINGFEILMASYAMAHLKLDMLLKQTGYTSPNPSKGGEFRERLHIYLTNSLDEARAKTELRFVKWLTDEANAANHVKQDVPVMVVLGNPPYSGESQNSGKWLNELMNDYKKEPSGAKLQEKNPKWINDDYVKFIRLGQHFINKNGEGILAFINNHGFLDNPTFRGMRYNLLKTFDKIYVLDLHGNAKKKETTPDGSKDENVFDIMQGVSINIFVKTKQIDKGACPLVKPPATTIDKEINSLADVYHFDLYGKRNEKFSFLQNNTLKSVKWKKVKLKEPYYWFVPKDLSQQKEYKKGFSVKELFTINGVGITTAHDEFVMDFNKDTLTRRFQQFKLSQPISEELHAKFNVSKKTGWNILDGWQNLQKSNNLSEYIKPITYRPFDYRYIFYEDKLVWRCVRKIKKHFLIGENIGLIINRPAQGGADIFTDVFITKTITDQSVFSAIKRSPFICPLYIYIKNGIADDDKRPYHKHHNLNLSILKTFCEKLNLPFTEEKETPLLEGAGGGYFAPIDVLDYIYAVLHSPTYREKYKEFLKIDFPRVPYPENAEQFWKLVALGGKLRCLHLLEDVEPQEEIADFPIAGSGEVEKVQYVASAPLSHHGTLSGVEVSGRVYINDTQYFDHVPTEAWNFYIGGYQPAQKWLKDRKGRTLDYVETKHYQKIIRALKETGEVMKMIELYVK